MDKKITMIFEKLEYIWENGVWSTVHNHLIAHTSLAQKLTELAVKNNILKLEDISGKKQDDSDKRST